jgi:four helix bundle protein
MREEQDLRKRTKDFALRIVRMFSALPKTTVAQVLGRQVLRSGTSVGANYREAFRGRSRAEFISKCGDSLRELEETDIGWNFSSMAGLCRSGNCPLFARNATNSRRFS